MNTFQIHFQLIPSVAALNLDISELFAGLQICHFQLREVQKPEKKLHMFNFYVCF